MGSKTAHGVRVGSIETTFEIVEALKILDRAGVSEVARHLDKPKTTVFDHLETLKELGYVVSTDDGYQIGTRFLDLGGFARKQKKIYQIGKPEVDALARGTGEHANLMIEEHGFGTFLYKAEGEEAVQLDTYSGHHVHLQTTALGKAILAYMNEDRIEKILDRHGLPEITENTVTDRESLYNELKTIREQGYATDKEERVKGMWCVAGPITNSANQPLGAVSVSGPKSRVQGDRFRKELPKKVRGTANVIEVNLTHS